jgi:hypothetical protein
MCSGNFAVIEDHNGLNIALNIRASILLSLFKEGTQFIFIFFLPQLHQSYVKLPVSSPS